jgi:hypothetical protein
VAVLLGRLREAGAEQQAAALLARDPAAHAPLDDPYGVAVLLGRLREAGAGGQATALAERAAAHAPLDNPGALAWLLDSLREADAEQQAAALAARLPAAGMFELSLEQEGRADQFRFGREPEGTPATPWGWDDLDLSPAVSRGGAGRRVQRPLGCPLADRPPDTPEDRFPAVWPAGTPSRMTGP